MARGIEEFLIANQAIVDKKGAPTPLFMLGLQRYGEGLQAQDEQQDAQLEMILAQQALIVQLLGVVTQNVIYLNEVSEWLIDLGAFSSQRIAYLQAAVAGIAVQVGYDLPDPSGLPNYPGPPPVPPWEDPGP